ncbi:unnamed protein product [Parnassius apollo]|uniref:(apollo) hypothetical protein n=1 Tax=Parnassius apollo TaxID=110799 RepID=A0A8S3XSB3_PARAO|nr:unnamed protein product [Parnassius apollo]
MKRGGAVARPGQSASRPALAARVPSEESLAQRAKPLKPSWIVLRRTGSYRVVLRCRVAYCAAEISARTA